MNSVSTCSQFIPTLRTVLGLRTIRLAILSIGSFMTLNPFLLVATAIYALWYHKNISGEFETARRRIAHEGALRYLLQWPAPSVVTYQLQPVSLGCMYHKASTNKSYFDPIYRHPSGGVLYLGALPCADHLQAMQQLGVQKVVSLVEPWEYCVSLSDVVQPGDWGTQGMQFAHFPSRDHEVVTGEILQQASRSVVDALQSGQSVYVHCRFGCGRSACIVIATLLQLLTIAGPTQWVQEVFNMMKLARPQIKLTLAQFDSVVQWYNPQSSVC